MAIIHLLEFLLYDWIYFKNAYHAIAYPDCHDYLNKSSQLVVILASVIWPLLKLLLVTVTATVT